MTPLKYVCLDTSVLVSCAFAEVTSLTPKYLEVIIEAMSDSGVRLLMPEIVIDELECVISSRCERHLAEINSVVREIESTTLGPTVKKKLGDSLKAGVKDMIAEANLAKDKIKEKIDDSEICEVLEITDEDIRYAIKLAASHRKPAKNKHTAGLLQADCLIIAALNRFSKLHPEGRIALCSQNTEDFASKTADGQGEYTLHADIEKTIPNLVFFEHPKKMLEEIGSPESEEIERYNNSYELEARATTPQHQDKPAPTPLGTTTDQHQATHFQPGFYESLIPLIDRSAILENMTTALSLYNDKAFSLPKADYSAMLENLTQQIAARNYTFAFENMRRQLEQTDYSRFLENAIGKFDWNGLDDSLGRIEIDDDPESESDPDPDSSNQ